jgi:hypothetical protein
MYRVNVMFNALRVLLASRNETPFIVFLPLLYWWKNPISNLEIFTKKNLYLLKYELLPAQFIQLKWGKV